MTQTTTGKYKARIEIEAGINNCLLICDKYTSDITSLTKHSLGFLEQQIPDKQMKRVLIVSDIEGDELVGEMFYQNLRKVVESGVIDKLITLGRELKQHSKQFGIAEKHCFTTTADFLKSNIVESFKNCAILLKVAEKFQPKLIGMRLQLLPHDTILEINFDAMLHNIDYFKSKIEAKTKLICMVKASAYGSGSVEVALAIQHYGCNYLGVAFANEGVELRQSGINIPIMVLNPMESSLYSLFKYELEPEIGNFRILESVHKYAKKMGITNFPVHLKFDTGMHRAGFELSEVDRLAIFFNSQKELKIVSVFSHLASADDPQDDSFTHSQVETFTTITQNLAARISYPFLQHILNSAGIERFPQYQFDMIRIGIGLWGVEQNKGNANFSKYLKNVCSLTTKIIQLKNIKSGESVGYNRREKAKKDMKIALLPLGYADGLNRQLGNRVGHVLIDGKKSFIVGNICMDLMMVDVTGMNVKEGDKAVIFNDQRPFSEIADSLKTIPYEVLTSISPRVKRVYFTEKL